MALTKEERQKKEFEKKVNNIMDLLECTREEAEDVVKTDKMIDDGQRTPYDFDKAKEKECAKMCHTGTRKAPTVYKFDKKPRKKNPTKASIIAELARFLEERSENACENIEILNKEKLISFKIGENTYEIDLKQKRKPKTK